MLQHLKPGVLLASLDTNRVTNAIYVSMDELGYHEVVSDFGNKMLFSTEELTKYYKLPKWYLEYASSGYPFETLKERWELQIKLLTERLEELTV